LLTVGKDALGVERRLAAGLLVCPACGGRLAGWGHARQRLVFGTGTISWRLRPRRARCAGCGVTHVLLPVGVLLRRRDEVVVIGTALAGVAAGMSRVQVARMLGRPVALVRGWVARFAGRAERVRQVFTVLACELDPDPPVLEPAGSAVADAVVAVFAAAGAAWRRWGRLVPALSPWELACAVTSGTLLARAIIAGPPNTNYAL
jgi:hypothetical protein